MIKWKEVLFKRRLFSPLTHLSLSLLFLPLPHSQYNCHENELLICFPKEFLMPRRPDSRNTTVVVWSTNNFPGLHCLSKALFHPDQIMWKMSLSKVFLLLFFSHKDVRWRELEFPNMLIRVSINSAPSSTVLESSFSMLEISCAWATQVCLWVRMQYVLKLKEYRIMAWRNPIKQSMHAEKCLFLKAASDFMKENDTCCVTMEIVTQSAELFCRTQIGIY